MQTPEYMVAQAALLDAQTKAKKLEQDKAVDFAGLAVRNRELDIRKEENQIRRADALSKTAERSANVALQEKKVDHSTASKLAELGVKSMAHQANLTNAQQEGR